jgi:MFS family permease
MSANHQLQPIVPGISDKIGRKPVMIAFSFVGLLTPAAVLYYTGSLTVLAVLIFIGCSGLSIIHGNHTVGDDSRPLHRNLAGPRHGTGRVDRRRIDAGGMAAGSSFRFSGGSRCAGLRDRGHT